MALRLWPHELPLHRLRVIPLSLLVAAAIVRSRGAPLLQLLTPLRLQEEGELGRLLGAAGGIHHLLRRRLGLGEPSAGVERRDLALALQERRVAAVLRRRARASDDARLAIF